MTGEPERPGAEAPVTRTAGGDHAIELVLLHLVAQRRVAPGVFLLRELLPDGVVVVGSAAHVGEGQGLVELRTHDLPRLRAERLAGRLDVHGSRSWRVDGAA